MKIARYAVDGRIALGQVEGEAVRDILTSEADDSGQDLLRRHIAGERAGSAEHAITDVRSLSPLARPDKILCIGLNYLDHCRESGVEPPNAPVLFSKYQNALIGPGDPIVFDPTTSSQVDFEVELAVIIGKRCRRVSEEDVMDHICGYTIANDVSARDAQFADGQWVRGKTFDSFCPLGPWIATADEIGDPQGLAIRCWVDDVLYQDGNTRDMIFGIRYLVSYLSRTMTLEPGDILATGTPWGVGFARDPQVFLHDGNLVRVAIEGIGEMANPVKEVA